MDLKNTASMYTVNMNISEASGDKNNCLADIFCLRRKVEEEKTEKSKEGPTGGSIRTKCFN